MRLETFWTISMAKTSPCAVQMSVLLKMFPFATQPKPYTVYRQEKDKSQETTKRFQ